MVVLVSPRCHAVLLGFWLQAFSCRYYSQPNLGHTPNSWVDRDQ